eukprot:34359_1
MDLNAYLQLIATNPQYYLMHTVTQIPTISNHNNNHTKAMNESSQKKQTKRKRTTDQDNETPKRKRRKKTELKTSTCGYPLCEKMRTFNTQKKTCWQYKQHIKWRKTIKQAVKCSRCLEWRWNATAAYNCRHSKLCKAKSK